MFYIAESIIYLRYVLNRVVASLNECIISMKMILNFVSILHFTLCTTKNLITGCVNSSGIC